MAEASGLRAAWTGSTITQEQIAELWDRDALPTPDLVSCRIPPVGEVVPAPVADERVVFYAHLTRGFGLPASEFTRDFLHHFGIQMHHLLANGVLFLAGYVTGTEAYLGLHPRVEHWARFFFLRPQTIGGRLVDCGGASVYNRNVGWPKLPRHDSAKGWYRTYFYVRNTTAVDHINLPPYSDVQLPAT